MLQFVKLQMLNIDMLTLYLRQYAFSIEELASLVFTNGSDPTTKLTFGSWFQKGGQIVDLALLMPWQLRWTHVLAIAMLPVFDDVIGP